MAASETLAIDPTWLTYYDQPFPVPDEKLVGSLSEAFGTAELYEAAPIHDDVISPEDALQLRKIGGGIALARLLERDPEDHMLLDKDEPALKGYIASALQITGTSVEGWDPAPRTNPYAEHVEVMDVMDALGIIDDSVYGVIPRHANKYRAEEQSAHYMRGAHIAYDALRNPEFLAEQPQILAMSAVLLNRAVLSFDKNAVIIGGIARG